MASPLPAPFHQAMALAWDSFRHGSLGIGAVITVDDRTVATGRNRLLEQDPGEDMLAGTSLAHAEMNAIAKLPWRQFRGEEVHLWTTLELCVQCLGAVRLSQVTHVHVLAPDPYFRGIDRISGAHAALADNWPVIDHRPVDEWAAFSLLFQTHVAAFWGAAAPGWFEALPALGELAESLVASGELIDIASSDPVVDEVAERLWSRLGVALDDIRALAAS